MKKFKIILSIVVTAFACLFIGASLQAALPEASHLLLGSAAVLFAGSVIVSLTIPQTDTAFTICGNIAKGVAPECAFPLIGGLEVTMYLGNKSDIASHAEVAGNPLIVTAITMGNVWDVPYTALTGSFVVGETLSAPSAAVGTVLFDNGTSMVIRVESGVFVNGEVITGNSSAAFATATTFTSRASKFFAYEGLKTSQEAKSAVAKGKYNTNFDHEVDLVVFNVDGVTKQQLDLMARGVLVAIVEYKYKGKGGNAAFEIFGLDQGLEVVKLDRDSASKDTDGAYQIQLKTIAGYTEPHLPRTFFSTDYATTLALVKGLL